MGARPWAWTEAVVGRLLAPYLAGGGSGGYFNDVDKEWLRKWPQAVLGLILMNLYGVVKEIATSSHRSYFNDFGKEL